MGDIAYMTGAQLQSAISATNQAVSGMTLAEAAAALGGTAQAQAGGAQITAFPLQYTNYTQVSLEAAYAAQTWQYWQTVAGATGTTVLGAAGAAAVSWAQGALIGTGEGLAATAGLLTLSVPTAVAMAAPLLGVGLGEALYNTNPELWNAIADGLVDFTTEATQTVTALIDEAGHVLIDSAFVQKLKQLFEDNEVPVYNPEESAESATSEFGTVTYCTSFQNYSQWSNENNYTLVTYTAIGDSKFIFVKSGSQPSSGPGESGYIYATNTANGAPCTEITLRVVNGSPTTTTRTTALPAGTSWIYDNKQVWYGRGSSRQLRVIAPDNGESIDSGLAWTTQYGESTTPPVEYPAGTNGWKNSSWEPSSSIEYPTVPVYDPNTGTTRPYYPVTPYVGDNPGTSVDPNTTPQQNPTTPITPEEWPIIEPYIPPVVNPEIQLPDPEDTPDIEWPEPGELVNPGVEDDPINVPVPDLNPELDPALDPFAEPVPGTEPCPEPAPDPATELTPPPSEGLSPDIIFPVPGVPFPSIVPAGSPEPLEPGVSGEPGFIQVYNPTYQEFVAFGRWLWVTYADATIDKIWNNPFDGIIGAHELYATPSKDGYSTIRSGFLDSGIGSIIVRQRYTQINCGSMVIPEYYGNYLDYSPYSKALCYLPFIGIVELNVDDIVGHAVNITYHVDSYNGSCIAQITCAKTGYTNTLYQFSGNCSVEVPMAGGSQAAIKAAMMTANAYQNAAQATANASLIGGIGSGLASIVGGAVSLAGSITGTGGVGQIASGIASMASGVANAEANRAYGQAQHTAQMLSGKSNVQHSGSFGASHGAMGIKTPYIILRRPIQVRVNNYNELYGYPAHKQVIVGNCTGFLRCREVHVISSLATDAEKTLIEQLLTTGVYVTE